MHRPWTIAFALGFTAAGAFAAPAAAPASDVRSISIGEPVRSSVPAWDARGTGLPAWQGIACADLSAGGEWIAVGTIAPLGDPNVFLIDGTGRVTASHALGVRWIHEVAVRPDGMCMALSAISTGEAGDRPKLCTLSKDEIGEEYPDPILFHYGDHSNHLGPVIASAGEKVSSILRGSEGTVLSFAVSAGGRAVAGRVGGDLVLVDRGSAKPLWERPLVAPKDPPPRMEQGAYGPRALPYEDKPVGGVLSVAIDAAGKRIAAAEYPGWRRILKGGVDQGIRFMPARPWIRIYDGEGTLVRAIDPAIFEHPLWCDLAFSRDGELLYAYPHRWACRGLASRPFLPVDDLATRLYRIRVASGEVMVAVFPDAIADVEVLPDGAIALACWDGSVYWLSDAFDLIRRIEVGAPSLLRACDDGRLLVAGADGIVRLLDPSGAPSWAVDLNRAAAPGAKPWTRDQRADEMAAGIWRTQGNRTHSDLGGQYIIEAPEGLLLIDPNAGASFEQNVARIRTTGHDPMDVRYVLVTHEHGDHAPGAYLWRAVTGARVIAGPETAYILQHTVPFGTGYGFHPPAKTDIVVAEDTAMDLAGLRVRIVRLPGHTRGSLGYIVEKGGRTIVAIGDLIMPGGVLGYSGHPDFAAEDVMESLRKLKEIGPDLVLGGHGSGDPRPFIDKGIEIGEATGWSRMKPAKPDPFYGLSRKDYLVAAWLEPVRTAVYPDADGDGKPDVVTYEEGPAGGRISIYRNRGGAFRAEADAVVAMPGFAPYGERKLRAAHLEGDRIADFLCSKSNGVGILASRGGRLEYDLTVIDAGAGWPMQMLLADMDGDERTDLLTGHRFHDSFCLAAGKGDGTFARPVRRSTFSIYFDLEALDLDGDGRRDVAVSSGDIFLAREDGALPETPAIRLRGFPGWNHLGAGDFDGDGDIDIAIVAAPVERRVDLHIFRNSGRRGAPFRSDPDQMLVVPGASVIRDGPTVADWNVDGKADLVLAVESRRGAIVILGGAEGLEPGRAVTVPFDYVAHYDTKLGVADFNGDGRPDIAGFGPTDAQAQGVYIRLQAP